jgi:hypothetical protein
MRSWEVNQTVVREPEFGLRLYDRACLHTSRDRLEVQPLRAPGLPLSIVIDETNLEAGSERTDDRLWEVLAVDRIPRFCEVLDLGLNHDEEKVLHARLSHPAHQSLIHIPCLLSNTISNCTSQPNRVTTTVSPYRQ